MDLVWFFGGSKGQNDSLFSVSVNRTDDLAISEEEDKKENGWSESKGRWGRRQLGSGVRECVCLSLCVVRL